MRWRAMVESRWALHRRTRGPGYARAQGSRSDTRGPVSSRKRRTIPAVRTRPSAMARGQRGPSPSDSRATPLGWAVPATEARRWPARLFAGHHEAVGSPISGLHGCVLYACPVAGRSALSWGTAAPSVHPASLLGAAGGRGGEPGNWLRRAAASCGCVLPARPAALSCGCAAAQCPPQSATS